MKKIMQTQLVTILLLILLSTTLFYGCNNDTIISSSFFEATAEDANRNGRGSLICDVIINKTEFQKEDVYLDYYFGYFEDEVEVYYPQGIFADYTNRISETTFSYVSISLYFAKSLIGENIYNLIDDYTAIEDAFFIKEVSYADFFTEEYITTVSSLVVLFRHKISYAHNEIINIDPLLFSEDNGSFYLQICSVALEKESGLYSIGWGAYIQIHYTKIDENTIQLSL
jgi:hypothetical protein